MRYSTHGFQYASLGLNVSATNKNYDGLHNDLYYSASHKGSSACGELNSPMRVTTTKHQLLSMPWNKLEDV